MVEMRIRPLPTLLDPTKVHRTRLTLTLRQALPWWRQRECATTKGAETSVRTVGQMAAIAGISVRALHHYEKLGLLPAASRSDSGYRLYTSDDLARLQEILSLRDLGFALAEIRAWFQDEGHDPHQAMRLHLQRVSERIAGLESLRDVLQEVLRRIPEHGSASPEQVVRVVERMKAMKDMERYFTSAQLESVKARGVPLGAEGVRAVEREWSELIAKVRAAMETGVPAGSAEVLALASRWKELIGLFSGGDSDIVRGLERYYREHPGVAAEMGIDQEMYHYIRSAWSTKRDLDADPENG